MLQPRRRCSAGSRAEEPGFPSQLSPPLLLTGPRPGGERRPSPARRCSPHPGPPARHQPQPAPSPTRGPLLKARKEQPPPAGKAELDPDPLISVDNVSWPSGAEPGRAAADGAPAPPGAEHSETRPRPTDGAVRGAARSGRAGHSPGASIQARPFPQRPRRGAPSAGKERNPPANHSPARGRSTPCLLSRARALRLT